mmetsp:Transcript_25941/g.40482  ORF Transcript_25941/g.40482 Transcript_25941/m.40482 type:complete len:119 (-) Transcript_25941:77-433(-)
MRRETREEMKWDIAWEDFDKYFLKEGTLPKRHMRHVVFKGTIVFVAIMEPGTARRDFNPAIRRALEDHTLPSCLREVLKVEWVDLDGNCVSCPGDQVSPFAKGVMEQIRIEYNLGTLL